MYIFLFFLLSVGNNPLKFSNFEITIAKYMKHSPSSPFDENTLWI